MTAAALFDHVGMTVASTGTGTITLGSALGAAPINMVSYQSFAAAGVANGTSVSYLILDANGAWEVGTGVYTVSGTTLSRTPTWSSNSNAAINMTASAQVFVTIRAEDILSLAILQSFSLAQQAQGRTNLYAAPFDALAYNGMQVNGSMDVSQFNAANSVAMTSGSGFYVVDNMLASFVSSTLVMAAQQVTPSGTPSFGQAFQQALQLKATTGAALGANDFAIIYQKVEGSRFSRVGFGNSNAQPISIGVWVYATVTGTVSCSLVNGASTRSQPVNASYTNAATWQLLTFTFTGDTAGTWLYTNGVGAFVYLCFGCGSTFQGTVGTWNTGNFLGTSSTTNFFASSNNLVQVTGLIVVPGTELPSASRAPFIMRPLPVELPLCQRYYEMSYSQGTVPGTATEAGAPEFILSGGALTSAIVTVSGRVKYSVTKRLASAVVTAYSPSTGASGKIHDYTNGADTVPNIYASDKGDSGFTIAMTANAAATSYDMQFHWTSDARL